MLREWLRYEIVNGLRRLVGWLDRRESPVASTGSLHELLGIDPDDPQVREAIRLVEADMSLIERLRDLRVKQALSVTDVASRLGVSAAAVGDIERLGGDPRLSTLRRYAMAIGTEITHEVRGASGKRPPTDVSVHRSQNSDLHE